MATARPLPTSTYRLQLHQHFTFDDAAAIDTAFGSPQGQTLMMHAREFIGEITTFLVETHVVK